MAKINWPNALRARYPNITFTPSDTFRWSPSEQTVFYGELKHPHDFVTLLHETGHAVARHVNYSQDLRLLKLEREAWRLAQRDIAPLFDTEISDETIEEALDSYRDWLHARSICPSCSSTGVQADESHYHCLACETVWRVNDARICGLKRYIIKQPR